MALVLVLAASCGDTPGSTGSSSPGDTQWSPGVAVIPMQPVASGTFTLGQNLGAGGATHNVTPLTPVTLTHGFQMGKYQVTREQWITVLEGNPNGIPVPHPNWSDAPPNQQEADAGFNVNRRPATHVSWYDAVVFANWLSIANGLTPVYEFQCESNNQWTTNPARWGTVPTLDSPSQLRDRWNSVRITSGNPTGYRLPTEAQWEFAAKGGVTADSYTFSGSDTVGDVAWTLANSGNSPRMVGLLDANGLGLHDMSGNVWEWVQDRHGVYPGTPQVDPPGAASGSFRVRRGGSWGNNVLSPPRSVLRNNDIPDFRWNVNGFRLARPAP